MAKPRTMYDKIWDDHLVHEMAIDVDEAGAVRRFVD